LQVTEAEIRQAIDRGEVGSLEDVFNSTGAGIGCTACHRRILKVLKQARIDEGMPAERLQPAGH
jgi:bacterioferritin-associated ferredoxin